MPPTSPQRARVQFTSTHFALGAVLLVIGLGLGGGMVLLSQSVFGSKSGNPFAAKKSVKEVVTEEIKRLHPEPGTEIISLDIDPHSPDEGSVAVKAFDNERKKFYEVRFRFVVTPRGSVRLKLSPDEDQ